LLTAILISTFKNTGSCSTFNEFFWSILFNVD
jgi:hypothetical protein